MGNNSYIIDVMCGGCKGGNCKYCADRTQSAAKRKAKKNRTKREGE